MTRAVLYGSFPSEVTEQPARVDFVLGFVAERISGGAAVMRLGVRLSALCLTVAVRLFDGVRLETDEPTALAVVLGRWADRPWPLLAEYSRLIRSLTLVAWFDAPDVVR
jgi:hypothetical protein